MLKPRRKWLWRLLATIAVLAFAALYFGITSRNDVLAYTCMPAECHPIWRALALKRVRAGESVTDVVKEYAPNSHVQFGRFERLNFYALPGDGLWFTGITLIARDRKLVTATAWSCTWQHTFFDELTNADREEFDEAFEAYVSERSPQTE